jgi:hypothetical protein
MNRSTIPDCSTTHHWVEIREGIRYCERCLLCEVNMTGTVIQFPTPPLIPMHRPNALLKKAAVGKVMP